MLMNPKASQCDPKIQTSSITCDTKSFRTGCYFLFRIPLFRIPRSAFYSVPIQWYLNKNGRVTFMKNKEACVPPGAHLSRRSLDHYALLVPHVCHDQ